MPKTPTPLALMLTEKHDSGFYHLIGTVVELHGPKDEDVKYPRDSWAQDLEINSQGDDQKYDGRRDQRTLYCWEVRYKPYVVELPEALRMVKTLQKVRRGLDKLNASRGYTVDFGDYVGRVCEILGITTILARRGRFDQDRRMALGEGVQHIRHLVHAWVEEGKRQTDPAAV